MKGDVVVLSFPFTDRSGEKKRPALVLHRSRQNLILAQITSVIAPDAWCAPIDDTAFREGGLRQHSLVRLDCLFTAHDTLPLYRAGRLRKETTGAIIERLCDRLRAC